MRLCQIQVALDLLGVDAFFLLFLPQLLELCLEPGEVGLVICDLLHERLGLSILEIDLFVLLLQLAFKDIHLLLPFLIQLLLQVVHFLLVPRLRIVQLVLELDFVARHAILILSFIRRCVLLQQVLKLHDFLLEGKGLVCEHLDLHLVLRIVTDFLLRHFSDLNVLPVDLRLQAADRLLLLRRLLLVALCLLLVPFGPLLALVKLVVRLFQGLVSYGFAFLHLALALRYQLTHFLLALLDDLSLLVFSTSCSLLHLCAVLVSQRLLLLVQLLEVFLMIGLDDLRVLLDDLAAQVSLQLVDELLVLGLEFVHLSALLPHELLDQLLAMHFTDLAHLVVEVVRA